MFAQTAAFPLFATPVWGFDLPADDARTINAGLLGRAGQHQLQRHAGRLRHHPVRAEVEGLPRGRDARMTSGER